MVQSPLATAPIDGSGLHELVTNIGSLPDGIAIDTGHQHIHWTNMGVPSAKDGPIQRSGLSGNNIVTIIPPDQSHTPKELTIALKSKMLYWSDRESMRVMGVVQNWCVGIAVDEESKPVFLRAIEGKRRTNFSNGSRKGRRYPGSSKKSSGTIDLELNHASGTLYWTHRGDPPHGNTVNSVALTDVSTNNVTPKIPARKLQEEIGLALDLKNNRMFFGDLGGSLYSANLDGSCRTAIFPDIGGSITGVIYVGE
ncbi:hypothetical protein N7447_002577 [Penicillium robsamsonii]|uniref:uncharacterized protein n=1 Tax=Penicillium robsamsonii TaxID=1792511 RepID=UPI00254968B9|nr:uncharacterized protein N7447_002577 [Penicillium robsamsonii]KAJ5836551.1 hypothetical protein N7447_002577 [Penicillium robsamsonii]